MPRKRNRGAFTIVELVIVIAVIALLATALVPTFGDVISKANDSKAMQAAKNAYTTYIIENNGVASEYMIYEYDGRFVALHNGAAVGVHESKEDALKAMVGEEIQNNYIVVRISGQNLSKVVPKNNVVDLVMFMGQSNMAGFGGTASQAPVVPEGHGYWFKAISDPTQLYPLTEPFGAGEENLESGLGNCQRNGSMVSAFANAYYENTGIPIVGVFAAQGSTKISDWQATGKLLPDAVNRYRSAKNWLEENGYTVRGDYMVWCQGEHDGSGGTSKQDYKTKFGNMLDTMKNAGIDTCFIVRVGVWTNSLTMNDKIIAAQTELCKERDDTVMVCTATAGFAEEGLMRTDGVHYTQEGYNKAGALAGEYAAYYVNTGVEPSMYDARYGNTYDPNASESFNVEYQVNTNIGAAGEYDNYGIGRITLTDYIPCAVTPVVEIDCEAEYVAAVQAAGGTDAFSAGVGIRYYDENKTFIGVNSNGNHAYIRLVLCVKDQKGNTDPGKGSITVLLPEDISEGWTITVNGVEYFLKNKFS